MSIFFRVHFSVHRTYGILSANVSIFPANLADNADFEKNSPNAELIKSTFRLSEFYPYIDSHKLIQAALNILFCFHFMPELIALRTLSKLFQLMCQHRCILASSLKFLLPICLSHTNLQDLLHVAAILPLESAFL